MIAALLLAGCGDSAKDPEINTPDNIDPLPQPEVPVVDAEAITALRQEAADAGKVLVVDCWATWCGSCVAMFPHLHKAIKERGVGVMLVSLSYDETDEETLKSVHDFLTEQDAWQGAYQAVPDSDAKDLIARALSDTWDGGVLPAVFVYQPDGTLAYEMLETRGEVQEWVDGITAAVDKALPNKDGSTE